MVGATTGCASVVVLTFVLGTAAGTWWSKGGDLLLTMDLKSWLTNSCGFSASVVLPSVSAPSSFLSPTVLHVG